MISFKSISAVILSTALISPVFADDDDHQECTDTALTAAELVNAASNTTCIQKRKNIEVVVAMNNNLFNGKFLKKAGSKVSQQAVNVRNLARDYETNYKMEHGEEFNVVVVAYAAGIEWLVKRYTDDIETTPDTNTAFVMNEILERGIKIYACQNTMKAKNLTLDDLIEGVETVPAGVTAVVDFQNQGMTYLVP